MKRPTITLLSNQVHISEELLIFLALEVFVNQMFRHCMIYMKPILLERSSNSSKRDEYEIVTVSLKWCPGFFCPFRYSALHNGKHTEQEKLSIQNDTESQESCFWHRPPSNEEHDWKVIFLTALPAAQTRPEPFTSRGQGAGLNCLLKELLNNEGKGNVAKGIWSVF